MAPQRMEKLDQSILVLGLAADALAILGATLIAVGLYSIFAPLAWLFLGGTCFAVSYAAQPRRGATRNSALALKALKTSLTRRWNRRRGLLSAFVTSRK